MFNIIIGEHHFYDTSVKIAKRLLESLQYDPVKTVVCFEHPKQLDILKYYTERNKLAIELADMAIKQNKQYSELLNHIKINVIPTPSKPTNTLAFTLFGKDRIIGFFDICNYCVNKKIAYLGIDTQQFANESDLEKKMEKRSDFMFNQIEDLNVKGSSTITIVGQSHLVYLSKLSKLSNINNKCNYYFILIEDKKDFLNFKIDQSIITQFYNTLKIASSSSLDKKTRGDMQGKALLLNQSMLENSLEIICSNFPNLKSKSNNDNNTEEPIPLSQASTLPLFPSAPAPASTSPKSPQDIKKTGNKESASTQNFGGMKKGFLTD